MKIKNPDLFIQRVREYPYLYDPSHPDFRKNHEKNLAWSEMAKEFNMPGVAEIRQKWRSLRNTYLRYKRSQMNPTGPDKEYCTWPWRHSMSFIDEYLNFEPPKALRPRLKPINVEDMWEAGNVCDSDPLNSSSDEKKEPPSPPPSPKKFKYEEEDEELSSNESVSEMNKESPNCSQNWQSDQEQLQQQQQEQEEEEQKLKQRQQQRQLKLQQQRVRQLQEQLKEQEKQLQKQQQQLRQQQQQIKQQEQQIKQQEQQLRKQQHHQQEQSQQHKPDGINRLFQSYEETFRKFRPKTQAMIKIKLSNLFAQTELNELCDE